MWPREVQKEEIASRLRDHRPALELTRNCSWRCRCARTAVRHEFAESDIIVRPGKKISAGADPNDLSFDAERAVAYHVRNVLGRSRWLIFLMTHLLSRPTAAGCDYVTCTVDLRGSLGLGEC